ncbi:MAG: DUF1194 domain-containing protein [Pikeienuella sp.]|uniref:DUF1194 domain-containing protein n=1 Tax=Pikeienuella sp. TaxID=2831957 RepID=UPI00391DA401
MRMTLAALLLLAAPAAAQDIEVDVELFLAVDVSRSMTPRELEIQRRGYAEALVSDEVLSAIGKGFLGRIALTYVEWAGPNSQRVVVPWTMIEHPEDAIAVAASITANFEEAMRRTSISGVLDYAAADFAGNGFESWRQVIDVSGDGPNNQGRPVHHARDDAIAAGFVINGLPLMTEEGLGLRWNLDDLDRYYEACVIGGPGAFVVPVRTWEEFPAAVRMKIVQELAGPPLIHRAQFTQAAPAYDCMIGEKIWERFRDVWGGP